MSLDKKDVQKAKELAVRLLLEKGIEDTFTVRVKPVDAPTANVRGGGNWVALYRNRSQFGSGPIFWVNKDLESIVEQFQDPLLRGSRDSLKQDTFDAILQNLLHEYGHVIYEWGHVRDEALRDIIDRVWKSEEHYAEDFLRYVRDDFNLWANEDDHKKVIRRYVREAFA